MVEILEDGYVCSDCLMMMANGECEGCTEERLQEIAERTAGWTPANDEEHPDMEFSWRTCVTCRSHLGGSRHFAARLGVPGGVGLAMVRGEE